MSTFFYRNPRLLILAFCLIVVAGLSSYQLLPRLEDPELTQRFAIIKTRYPGASPERVETLVTDPIEDVLAEVQEIKKLKSKTVSELSVIQVELADEIGKGEASTVWSQVRDKLNDVRPRLPPEAGDPEYEELHARAHAVIISVSWNRQDEPNYSILKRLAEDLEDELRGIPGTEDIELFGDPAEEIVVEVDHERLLSLGMTVSDLSHHIQASDAKVAAGQLRSKHADLLLEVESELDGLQTIQNIPIQLGDNGHFTTLGNVATVKKSVIQPMSQMALIDGKPSITVGAFVQSDYRIDHWASAVQNRLEDFKTQVPGGISVDVIFDQSQYTVQRFEDLLANLLIGAFAVMFVVLVLMGWKTALLIGVALPLSALMVLTGMRFLEIPIHQMSVTGLIIALGMLIDNAIVVVDDVRHRLSMKSPPIVAISDAVHHLAVPLFGSTLTTALAFAPIAIMSGPAGEFVGSIAISVILALFSSLFVSLTIVVAITGMMGCGISKSTDRWWQNGIQSKTLSSLYQASLDFAFRRPAVGVSMSLVLPIAGFVGAMQLQEQFFPPADRDQFYVELMLPAQTSITETKAQALAVGEVLEDQPEITNVYWFLGKSAPSFYYSLPEYQYGSPHYAQAMVQLKSSHGATQLIHRLQRLFDQQFPQSQTLVRQLEQGPPFEAPLEVQVFGPNLVRLREFGDQIRQTMSSVPHVIHTRADMSQASPGIGLKVKEDEARLAHLSNRSVANQLQAALEGHTGGSVMEGTEELPVRVRVSDEIRSDMDMITSLELLSEAGNARDSHTVPLNALATYQLRPENAVISRINGRRVNIVQGFSTAGVLPQAVLEEFQEAWDNSELAATPGYSFQYGGESAERNNAVGNLMANVGLLAILMIITLVVSFGSFRVAGMICLVGGMSVGLGLGALSLFGFPFGFMAIVGTMGLIGIAINDAIVVLAAIREDSAARAGDKIAIRNVVNRSTRHVVATTFTTMAGFTPLLLAGGGFWPPLAVAIGGGVFGATILALYFVPSVHLLLCCKSATDDFQGIQTVGQEFDVKSHTTLAKDQNARVRESTLIG